MSLPASPAAGPAAAPDRPLDVVVVAYGAPELLDRCLGTLGTSRPVVVVDNSSDPAVRAVAGTHGAAYVDPGANLGFAGGVDVGLAARPHPAGDVLLLNPDAEIEPGAVDALHRALLAGDDLAAVAPAQRDPATGGSARVAWPFPTPAGAWVEAVGLGGLRRRPDFLIGSVLLLRAEALAAAGPFDDRFFLYAEETDWQRRARDLGWSVALVPTVTASHVGAGTGGDRSERATHFHASHERYVRLHHGAAGWAVYRAGTLAGSAVRAALLPGERRREAAHRVRLYRTGPLRAERRLAGPGPAGRPLTVVHVALTDNFAGVERYVCQVAGGLAGRGHTVVAVGGDPVRMAAELDPRVTLVPAAGLAAGVRALARVRGADVVHVHMTAAEGAAWVTAPLHGAAVVATRHFARDRGSSTVARALAGVAARRIDREVAISRFVADSVRGPTVLLPNAVADRPAAPLGGRTVLMLQRLDEEKAPDVGLRAWARSGLGRAGWRLVVAGDGVLAPGLHRLVGDLGVADSVAFVGHVADTDAALAGAEILLATAPAEPFGLAVVEAMAHGVPVVAADGGAHRETVDDPSLRFPPGDADAAAALLVTLAGDEARRRRVGAALRARQQAAFGLGAHLDGLERLYREVVAER